MNCGDVSGKILSFFAASTGAWGPTLPVTSLQYTVQNHQAPRQLCDLTHTGIRLPILC